MINGKSVVAIIPARSGSKGLPGKNTKSLCGRPLIAWSIEHALRSNYIDETIVSTDSSKIAEIAVKYGARVPFLRPPKLATDTATMFSVVEHCLAFCEAVEKQHYEYTILLEPTSPIREDEDIDRIIALLDSRQSEFDAVISLGKVSEHPTIVKRLSGEYVFPFYEHGELQARRQDLEEVYFPYGAIYALKTKALLETQSFYQTKCGFFLLKPHQCIDIDDEIDFICAEAIMKVVQELQ
jgi:CMP-N-acetylneuraminic acid synthetase